MGYDPIDALGVQGVHLGEAAAQKSVRAEDLGHLNGGPIGANRKTEDKPAVTFSTASLC